MIEAQPAAVPLHATSLRSGDGTAWLNGATASLKGAGLPANATVDGVDLSLRHAQAWTGGMNIHSHAVLQASYQPPAACERSAGTTGSPLG